jgi:hypothetical protein
VAALAGSMPKTSGTLFDSVALNGGAIGRRGSARAHDRLTIAAIDKQTTRSVMPLTLPLMIGLQI